MSAVVISPSGLQLTTEPNALIRAADVVSLHNDAADAVLEQAKRANIIDDESVGRAGDLVKSIIEQQKILEAEAKIIKSPINALLSTILDLFKKPAATYVEAKSLLSTKQTGYLNKRNAEEAARRAAGRRAIEEAALKVAAEHEAAGQNVAANAVLDIAEKVIQKTEAKTTTVSGAFGASVGTRKVYEGQVTSLRLFLSWAAEHATDKELESISIGKLGLNALAKRCIEGKIAVNGFAAKCSEVASNR